MFLNRVGNRKIYSFGKLMNAAPNVQPKTITAAGTFTKAASDPPSRITDPNMAPNPNIRPIIVEISTGYS
jgi:hypothetical protein